MIINFEKKINKHKKYYIATCTVIFLFFYVWLLKHNSTDIIIQKFISYLCFCSVFYYGFITEKDIFSPFTLFSVFYFCLLIYSSNVSSFFLPEISNRSFLLILVGSSSFLLGMISLKLVLKKFRSKRLIVANKRNIRSYNIKYSYWLLLFFGLIPTILSIATKGMPIMMVQGLSGSDIEEIRLQFPMPIISMFSCLTNVALITVMKTRKKISIIIVLLLVLLSPCIIFAKLDIVMTLFFAYCGSVKYKLISKNSSKIIFAIVVILLFFGLSQSFRYARGGEADVLYKFEKNYINDGSSYYSENMRDFYLMYMYVATPFSNLDYIFENIINFKNGRLTFWSLTSISQIKRLYDIQPIQKPFRAHPFNTHTFLADFYMDYGVLGILFLPFILGIFVYFFYSRTFFTDNPLIISIYLYWGLATLMMFFSNHFTSVGYPIHYLIVIESYKKASQLMRTIKKSIFISKYA